MRKKMKIKKYQATQAYMLFDAQQSGTEGGK